MIKRSKSNATALLFIVLILLSTYSYGANDPKRVIAVKTTEKAVIDGNLDEDLWKKASKLEGYTDFRLNPGKKADHSIRTETYLTYSDEGIYFGGFCHEVSRDDIAMELSGRDGFGVNDYIGITFDTYNDQQNGFEYFVTPLGEQWDAKVSANSNNSEDFTWNAVWQSGTQIHDNGWSFEIFIPYGAIRFSSKDIQNWGFNVTRRRKKTEEQFTWNPIDINVNGYLTQEGFWDNLVDIKPPIRLQFSPYVSVYANHNSVANDAGKHNAYQYNGGMDVKFGLNESYTLDMTLIPDFGQVQSDNQVLNLSAFEVRYNENRAFFTEGTELFSKGELFYSRRIGGQPIHKGAVDGQLKDHEVVSKNPNESKLINATKISGRNNKGLGIGILNAITHQQVAVIENEETQSEREYVTDPLTNYNVFVLDQTIKNNSSLSLINTNVLRFGDDYDANVTAGLFSLNDKSNTWNLRGESKLSHQTGTDGETGYSQSVRIGKVSGKYTFDVWHRLVDSKYNHGDLGFFRTNNRLTHGMGFGARWLEPNNWRNSLRLNFGASNGRLYKAYEGVDKTYLQSVFSGNMFVQFKNLWASGANLRYRTRNNDFNEGRAYGRFLVYGASLNMGWWLQSNNAKKYAVGIDVGGRTYSNYYDYHIFQIGLNHQYRFSNKVSLRHRINLNNRINNVGFSYWEDGQPIFAIRDRQTIENVLNFKYSFTNKMGLTFRARHYLSNVDNHDFYDLEDSGLITYKSESIGDRNQNVNFFNIDMVYTWQFNPGSFLNVVWKDATSNDLIGLQEDYLSNIRGTINGDHSNSISVKLIYFLDYHTLRG